MTGRTNGPWAPDDHGPARPAGGPGARFGTGRAMFAPAGATVLLPASPVRTLREAAACPGPAPVAVVRPTVTRLRMLPPGHRSRWSERRRGDGLWHPAAEH